MKKKDKAEITETVAGTEVSVPKKKKKKKISVIIAIILIVLLVVWMVSCSLMPKPAPTVITTTAVRGDLQESISTSGTVESEETVSVFAPVNGKLQNVNIVAGDAVAAGDVLIGYDMQEIEHRLQEASLQQEKSTAVYNGIMADNSQKQADFNEATHNLGVLEQQLKDYNARLDALEDELETSKRQTNNALASEGRDLSKRSTELQKKLKELDQTAPDYAEKAAEIQQKLDDVSDQISNNQYQQQTANTSDYVAETEKEIAEIKKHISECEEYKAEMKSQKTSSEGTILNSYEKQQHSADKELANMTYADAEADYNLVKDGIRAEFDGIVTECNIVEGETVTEGAKLLTLANSTQVKVTFRATKQDVAKLAVDQKADVTISGNTYEGVVSKIDRQANANESGTPMVGVEIHIINPDEKIILGLDAKLTVYTHKAENALLIPAEVINADKDGDFLYVVEDGVVVRKPIVCGVSSDSETEVIEGITENDQVIVTAYTEIVEGMAVTAVPEQ